MMIKIENPLLMHLSEAEVTTNLSTYIWRSGPCHNWFESSSGPFKLKAPSLRLIPRATWGSSLDLLPTLNSVSKICKRTKIIFLHDRGVRRCRSKNSDLKNRGKRPCLWLVTAVENADFSMSSALVSRCVRLGLGLGLW